MLHLRPDRLPLPPAASPASSRVPPSGAPLISIRRVKASAIMPGDQRVALSSARLPERRADGTREHIPRSPSRSTVHAPLRSLLASLPADDEGIRATLAGLGVRLSMACEPMFRRALAEEIAAAAPRMPAPALRALSRELAQHLGGPHMAPKLVTQLLEEMAGDPSLDGDAVRAITAGLASALGAPLLADPHLDALLAPALVTLPQAWEHRRRDALLLALADLLGPQGGSRLQARIADSTLPDAEQHRLTAVLRAPCPSSLRSQA